MSKRIADKEKILLFLKSEQFGLDAWAIIYNFGLNVHNIILTIELYGVLIERLDQMDRFKTISKSF